MKTFTPVTVGGIPWDLARQFLRGEMPAALRPLLPLVRAAIAIKRRRLAWAPDYHFAYARAFADRVSIPVMCVGGVRSLESCERILAESRVQMVSLARPLVREPDLPRSWRQGRRERARCLSCNRCYVKIGLGFPLRCDLESGGIREV